MAYLLNTRVSNDLPRRKTGLCGNMNTFMTLNCVFVYIFTNCFHFRTVNMTPNGAFPLLPHKTDSSISALQMDSGMPAQVMPTAWRRTLFVRSNTRSAPVFGDIMKTAKSVFQVRLHLNVPMTEGWDWVTSTSTLELRVHEDVIYTWHTIL